MQKEFTFRGRTVADLKNMELKDFIQLLPSRQRRSLSKGFTDQQKCLLEKIRKNPLAPVKTQCRDMIVIPEMLGSTLLVYNGHVFSQVLIIEEMLGHYLGELSLTRQKVKHSAPGVGATKSSAAISVK